MCRPDVRTRRSLLASFPATRAVPESELLREQERRVEA